MKALRCAEKFPWDGLTCARAAKGGHLEVLKWAHANGCPWDAKTCETAAWNGHLETLKWAHANGCPLNAKVRTFLRFIKEDIEERRD